MILVTTTWALFWKVFPEPPLLTVFNLIAPQGPRTLRDLKRDGRKVDTVTDTSAKESPLWGRGSPGNTRDSGAMLFKQCQPRRLKVLGVNRLERWGDSSSSRLPLPAARALPSLTAATLPGLRLTSTAAAACTCPGRRRPPGVRPPTPARGDTSALNFTLPLWTLHFLYIFSSPAVRLFYSE